MLTVFLQYPLKLLNVDYNGDLSSLCLSMIAGMSVLILSTLSATQTDPSQL